MTILSLTRPAYYLRAARLRVVARTAVFSSSASNKADPTMIHEYKHNYDESEWAPETACPINPKKSSPANKHNNKTLLYEPLVSHLASYPIAYHWRNTPPTSAQKQNMFNINSSTTTQSTKAEMPPLENKPTEGTTTTTTKHPRRKPFMLHSPPYVMSHYYTPKSSHTHK